MARNYYAGDVNAELISRQVTLMLRKPASHLDEKASEVTVREIVPDRDTTADKEWARLLPTSGQLQRGCVLDAMMSPEEPKNLVASLTCLRVSDSASYGTAWEPGKGKWVQDETADGRADVGRQAADYRVFVLDPDGKPVALTAFGRETIAAGGPEFGCRIEKYAAIGAIIPLTKWFDMKKPGEYTVLVTLKAPEESRRIVSSDGHSPYPLNGHGPLWVAKPIKVRVPAAKR
jgi:hypothetical protein